MIGLLQLDSIQSNHVFQNHLFLVHRPDQLILKGVAALGTRMVKTHNKNWIKWYENIHQDKRCIKWGSTSAIFKEFINSFLPFPFQSYVLARFAWHMIKCISDLKIKYCSCSQGIRKKHKKLSIERNATFFNKHMYVCCFIVQFVFSQNQKLVLPLPRSNYPIATAHTRLPSNSVVYFPPACCQGRRYPWPEENVSQTCAARNEDSMYEDTHFRVQFNNQGPTPTPLLYRRLLCVQELISMKLKSLEIFCI